MKTLKTLTEFKMKSVDHDTEGLIYFENNKVMLKNIENNNTYYVSTVHKLNSRLFMTIYTESSKEFLGGKELNITLNENQYNVIKLMLNKIGSGINKKDREIVLLTEKERFSIKRKNLGSMFSFDEIEGYEYAAYQYPK